MPREIKQNLTGGSDSARRRWRRVEDVDEWGSPRDLSSLTAGHFELAGEVFRAGDVLYRTTGDTVGEGGMGVAYFVDRKDADGSLSRAVAKLYWTQLIERNDHDPVARRHFEHNLDVLRRLRGIRDLHLMPIWAAEPIEDNFLVISPYLGEPLATLLDDEMSAQQRVSLVLQATRGLRTLHSHSIVHNDVTPHNILVGDPDEHAVVLFDFDLSVATDLLHDPTYQGHFDARVIGAPEYSVSPEVLDPLLVSGPIAPQRDIYAVGTCLWSLFTEASIYGDVPDLAALLERIAGGMVKNGVSSIEFPDEVPRPLRAIIARCMELDPADRYPDAGALILALERAHAQLSPRSRSRFRTTLGYVQPERGVKLSDVIARRVDPSVDPDEIRRVQALLQRFGYLVERSLGRVKRHPIFVVTPDPNLVITGRFRGVNTYRKIVTCIDLRDRDDADEYLLEWTGCVMPILESVRTQHLTALHRVEVDRPSGSLLLFSEHIADPRFGGDLTDQELSLREGLGLGFIVVDQVARLHEHGLAHNNVALSSLLFKGYPRTGEAYPFFVGLVDPSFAGEDLLRDVQRLAGMAAGFLHPSAIAEAGPDHRAHVEELTGELSSISQGAVALPPVTAVRRKIGDALAAVEPNFGVVRANDGDPVAFAHMMIGHALYRRLWKSKP